MHKPTAAAAFIQTNPMDDLIRAERALERVELGLQRGDAQALREQIAALRGALGLLGL